MGNNSEIERIITKSDVHLEGMEVFGLGHRPFAVHKLDEIMKALYVYYGEADIERALVLLRRPIHL